MSISYFKNYSWDEIAREERMFCAELFYHLRDDPSSFIKLLVEESNIPSNLSGPWEAAFIVIIYINSILN
ncbi:MAG: hypothetical protein ACFFFT_19945 [Candidatus Thorarchaeota archaeon]